MKNGFIALGVVGTVIGVVAAFLYHSERKDNRLLDSIDRVTPGDKEKAECLRAFIEKRSTKAGAKISSSNVGINLSC